MVFRIPGETYDDAQGRPFVEPERRGSAPDLDAAHLGWEQTQAELRRLQQEHARLRRVRMAAERVVAKYREEDPWIDPTQLFEELSWLGDALDETSDTGTYEA